MFDRPELIPVYTFDDGAVSSRAIGSSTSAITVQDAFEFRRIISDAAVNARTFHHCFQFKALASCS